MKPESAFFGQTHEGEDVTVFTLSNSQGICAKILNFGGVLYSLETPDRNGNKNNIVANCQTVQDYQQYRPFFGSLVGRFANRIARGRFVLDGVEYRLAINNGVNALHGGLKGFDQVLWEAEPVEYEHSAGVRLSYHSPDGEEGYPGNLDVTVIYKLTDDNELVIDYTATTDKATHVNMTNHTFWNLAGAQAGSILDHRLWINSLSYLPTDDGLIPTGDIAAVYRTPLEFRGKSIGQDIAKITDPKYNGGYDHCYVLPAHQKNVLVECAFVYEPVSGRSMRVYTTEPGFQLYTGNFLDGTIPCGTYRYGKQSAFCIEAQHYPDSPNRPEFPSTLLKPGEVYRQKTVYRFDIGMSQP